MSEKKEKMINGGLSFLLSTVNKVSRSPINLHRCVKTVFPIRRACYVEVGRFLGTQARNQGGARGAFAPPQDPKVRILTLNIQV